MALWPFIRLMPSGTEPTKNAASHQDSCLGELCVFGGSGLSVLINVKRRCG